MSILLAIRAAYRLASGGVKAVPRWCWGIVGAVLLILLAVHIYHNKIAEAKAEQKATDDAIYNAWAVKFKAKADAIAASATTIARSKNDEIRKRIVADSNALLLRGPGRAACSSNPGGAGPADKRSRRSDETDAPVADLHSYEREPLIGLPYADTVAFAAQSDQCIADLRAYEDRDALIAKGLEGLAEK